MNLLQIALSILFFYVLALGAVLLTWYTVKSIKQFIKDGQEHQDRPKKPEQPPPDIGNESTRLHISGGLIEVNRLPDEQEKP